MQVTTVETNGEALRRVEAHTQSEFTNDIDVIMSTVSAEVCYILPDLSKDEVVLASMTTRDQVRDAYIRERELLDIVRSRHLVEASSNYFVFYESLATTRGRQSGEEVDVNSAVLFPVAADGIIGELLWSNGSLGSGIRASAQGSGPSVVARERSTDPIATRRANFDAHDAFVSAWRAGDAKRVGDCFDESCQWMIRDHRQPGTAVTHLSTRSEVDRLVCRPLRRPAGAERRGAATHRRALVRLRRVRRAPGTRRPGRHPAAHRSAAPGEEPGVVRGPARIRVQRGRLIRLRRLPPRASTFAGWWW